MQSTYHPKTYISHLLDLITYEVHQGILYICITVKLCSKWCLVLQIYISTEKSSININTAIMDMSCNELHFKVKTIRDYVNQVKRDLRITGG